MWPLLHIDFLSLSKVFSKLFPIFYIWISSKCSYTDLQLSWHLQWSPPGTSDSPISFTHECCRDWLLCWLIFQSIIFIPQIFSVVVAAQLFPLVPQLEKSAFDCNYYQVMLCSLWASHRLRVIFVSWINTFKVISLEVLLLQISSQCCECLYKNTFTLCICCFLFEIWRGVPFSAIVSLVTLKKYGRFRHTWDWSCSSVNADNYETFHNSLGKLLG